MPLQRRIPKRGFCNPTRSLVANVDVGALEDFEAGSEITIETLREQGLLRGRFDRVKVLGSGQLTKKLTVVAHAFSGGATAKIEKAGGKAVVLPSSRRGPATKESSSD